MDDLIQALTILKKYVPSTKITYPTTCHDGILMLPRVPQTLEETDTKKLNELGFYWCAEYKCWGSFKFGRCL